MPTPVLDFRRNGLIFVDELARQGLDPRELRRAQLHGAVVRVRRGVYCSREIWDAASPRERHLLVIRAVVAVTHPPLLVAGRSAAAAWGMPFAAAWPDEVSLLTPYQGGGKSEIGVRRTSAGASGATGTTLDDLPITSLARTALDVARALPLPCAVATLDWAMWRKNPGGVDRAELEAELLRAHYARGGAFLRHALGLATELSDSVGESMARIGIHLLGFEAPELQVRFADGEGEIFPDFFWRGASIAGEFDGKVKYTRAEFSRGDPAEVAWQEKKREDRLRRQIRGVVRILSEHVAQPVRLEALLAEAGVPRALRRRPGSGSLRGGPGYGTTALRPRGSLAP